MSIFGRWLRANGHDALSSIDMEATRAALRRHASLERDINEAAAKATMRPVYCVGRPDGCQQMIRVRADAPGQQIYVCSPACERSAEERKEQSIIAALVFGCSCGSRWFCWGAECRDPRTGAMWIDREELSKWFNRHTHCAGLDSMLREGA